jgi:pyruvate, orthophosphate dikinase
MVYGSHNHRSGTGIAYSRNPQTGAKEIYGSISLPPFFLIRCRAGDFLWRGEGEDVVHGSHVAQPLMELKKYLTPEYVALGDYLDTLERTYKDAQVMPLAFPLPLSFLV